MRTDSTAEDGSGSQSDFDGAVEAFRKALRTYVTGDPNPVMELFSRRDDVTLANPLGPPRRGPAEVDKAAREGAAMLKDGSVRAPPKFVSLEACRADAASLGLLQLMVIVRPVAHFDP